MNGRLLAKTFLFISLLFSRHLVSMEDVRPWQGHLEELRAINYLPDPMRPWLEDVLNIVLRGIGETVQALNEEQRALFANQVRDVLTELQEQGGRGELRDTFFDEVLHRILREEFVDNELDPRLRNVIVRFLEEDFVGDLQVSLEDAENIVREKIKGEKTLLFKKQVAQTDRLSFNVGFYKRDVKRLGILGGKILGNVLFHKKFVKERKKHVLQRIVRDSKVLLGVLADFKYKYEVAGSKREKANARKGLMQHLSQEHKFIKHNPFNGSLDKAVLGFFLSQELLLFLDKKVMQHDIYFSEAFRSYEHNEDGELEVLPYNELVFSAVSLLYFLYSPVTTVFTYGKEIGGEPLSFFVRLFTNVFGISLPQFASNYSFQLFLRIITFWIAIKLLNSFSNHVWQGFVFKNYDELIDLLSCYEKAKEGRISVDVDDVHQKIVDFVNRGHRKVSFFSIRNFWNYFKADGFKKTTVTLLFVAPILWKLIPFLWNTFSQGQEVLRDTQEAVI